MPANKAQLVARERKWAVPVAGASLLAVALLIAGNLAGQVSGDGSAEVLRSTSEHTGSVALTGVLQAVGFLLIAAPLYYLFRAAEARSPRVRRQFVGLVLVAPVFLAVASALTIGVRNSAADQFVAGEAKSTLSASEAKEKCTSQREDEGREDFEKKFDAGSEADATTACEKEKIENEAADNATREASLAPISSILGFAGGLAMIAALIYTCLWAMRAGLLARFWGTLGMVSGVALLLGPLFVITLAWFIYFSLLLLGRVPGGRPPAWEAGEAIPWPTPGEKAAEALQGPGLEEGPDPGELVQAPELPPAPEAPEGGQSDGPDDDGGGERRKRKKRG